MRGALGHPGYNLVYEDERLIVVCKDAGLLTTPAPGGEDSLVDALKRTHFSVFPVHRLDRETSGLLVFARSSKAAASLSKQLAGSGFERVYHAILAGTVADDRGTIDAPLDGRRAVTHFETLTRGLDVTLVAVTLETGRRNQIRRHFADRGHPILGETRWEADKARHPLWPHARLALHARTLGFRRPGREDRLKFEAPVPPEFALVFPPVGG